MAFAVGSAVRIAKLWPEGRLLTGVSLEEPPKLRALHERVGQYLMLSPPIGPAFPIALASLPGSETLELLLGADAQRKLGLAPGASVEVSDPTGPGFPLERALGADVLVFGTGSALAPLAPLLDAIAHRRSEFGKVRAYFGALTEDAHAYRGRDAGWIQAGIEVLRSGARPWVQELYLADPPPFTQPFAFAAGLPVMIRGVEAALASRGVASDRLGLNV